MVVDGQVFLIDSAAHTALLADVQQFARQSVAHVHHGRGQYVGLSESLDNVAARLGLELPLQQVFLAGKVGLEVTQLLQRLLVSPLSCLVHLLVVHRFFPFEQLQSHVGGSKIARNAYQVGVFCTVAIYNPLFLGLADAGDADGKAREGRGGVAAHDVHVPLVAGGTQSLVEQFHVFHGEAFAHGHADRYLSGGAVHGKHIAQVHHGSLVAQVAQVGIGQVEVHALHQQVGGHQHLPVGIVQHGTVVSHPMNGGCVAYLQVVRQSVYQSKFS